MTHVRKEHRYFDITPRIVRAGQEATITIRPLFDHCRFSETNDYQVIMLPTEGVAGQTSWPPPQPLPFALSDGTIRVSSVFESEQEYALLVTTPVVEGKRPDVIAEFRLYALAGDLFERRPFKGDIHMHSHYSDGRESPAYVAGACRRIGLDFMALTDHHQYAPSLEAMGALARVDIDLRIYPGEEVHPPGNPVHIVNFGGAFSLNALFPTDAYRDEVEAIAKNLRGLPAEVECYPYASCVWCFDKIREGGGLGLFCHPYWLSRHRYDVPVYLTDLMFERQPYDALELIGGYHRFELESNNLQVARYHEERAKGKQIPVVGVSDAHGCERGELFGWFYTIVFAPSAELPDLIDNVKALYSVAIEALPGEQACAFGPFRLVKYAQFLLREIFPQHDELCVEEGRLMLAFAAGDEDAAEMLRQYKGRTGALYDRFWAS
ncbi:MAG: PHP domain-containing protein [Anaerolineae bacterium]|nr:PHP domain-containing protein [Anaerolineae bacterium]